MATFLVAHGAWSAGWAWKKMRPLLRDRGHELVTPTYTGLGERAHLARPEVDLETHIADVLGVLQCEDLRDVILVGHSYGGMVATGVADRVPERLAQLVYLDAFVPRSGQALADLTPQPPGGPATPEVEAWRVPANPAPPDTSEADLAWIVPRRVPQPRKTFEQALKLSGASDLIPTTYIYCTRPRPGDVFGQFAERARREPGWRYLEIDATHNPHITAPDALAAALDSVVSRGDRA
ncbi:MAG: alpha/beta hydrolase [Candidatus Rokuibacteriota bacterium]